MQQQKKKTKIYKNTVMFNKNFKITKKIKNINY